MSVDIQWVDANARARFDTFIATIERRLAVLPAAEAAEIRAELSAHVLDHLAETEGAADTTAVDAAIARLGDLDTFLPELVDEFRLNQSARRGNPVAIASMVVRGVSRSVLDAVCLGALGLAYLFVFATVAIAFYSLFNPDAGLWLNSGGGFTLSFEHQPNATQAFRNTFWLVGVVLGAVAYTLLTLILRFWLHVRPSHS